MRKGRHAEKPGRVKEKIIPIRMTWDDFEILRERAEKSGARSLSAYGRRCMLTGAQVSMPPFETLRDLRNEVISLRADLRVIPDGRNKDRILEAIFRALDRIARL